MPMPPLRTLRISQRSWSLLSCIRSPDFQLVDQFRIFKVSNQLLKTTCMSKQNMRGKPKTLILGPFHKLELRLRIVCDNAHGRLSEGFLPRQSTTKHDKARQPWTGW